MEYASPELEEDEHPHFASSQAQDVWDDGAIINMFQTALELHADPTDLQLGAAQGDTHLPVWHARKPFGAPAPLPSPGPESNESVHALATDKPSSSSPNMAVVRDEEHVGDGGDEWQADEDDTLFSETRAEQHRQLQAMMLGGGKREQHVEVHAADGRSASDSADARGRSQQRRQRPIHAPQVTATKSTNALPSQTSDSHGHSRAGWQTNQQGQSKLHGTRQPETFDYHRHQGQQQQQQQQRQQQQQQQQPPQPQQQQQQQQQHQHGAPGGMPPLPMNGLQGMDDDGLSNLLWSWYYAGYNTGRYQAFQQMKSQQR